MDCESSTQYGAQLIFVGGAPRSGTTLLQNVLDAHPRIVGGPEFDCIPDIIALRNRLRSAVTAGRISVFTSVEKVDEGIRNLILDLLIPYLERRRGRYLSEKTPANVLVAPDLLELFPLARFLFCIRDPRAVAASMYEVGRRGKNRARDRSLARKPVLPLYTQSIANSVRTIERYNESGFDVATGQHASRVFLVKYEDLVTNPEAATRRMLRFLDIPWEETVLHPGAVRHDGDYLVDGVWTLSEGYRGNPNPTHASNWQETLPAWKQRLLQQCFAGNDSLISSGYALPDSEVKVLKRLIEYSDAALRLNRKIVSAMGRAIQMAGTRRI